MVCAANAWADGLRLVHQRTRPAPPARMVVLTGAPSCYAGPMDENGTNVTSHRGVMPRCFEYLFSLIGRETQKAGAPVYLLGRAGAARPLLIGPPGSVDPLRSTVAPGLPRHTPGNVLPARGSACRSTPFLTPTIGPPCPCLAALPCPSMCPHQPPDLRRKETRSSI